MKISKTYLVLASLGLFFYFFLNFIENKELLNKIPLGDIRNLIGSLSSISLDNNKENKVSEEAVNGILAKENKEAVSDYFFYVKFNPLEKSIEVKERIVWRNNTNRAANELFFHLYPNAYKSFNTIFMKGKYQIDDAETKKEFLEKYSTEIKFSSILVNRKESKLNYSKREAAHVDDNTVGYITLDKPCSGGDSIQIDFEYKLKIPEALGRFGHSANQNLYFISQWFPKLGVYNEEDGWICSPFYQFTEFFADFSNYEIILEHPVEFSIASSGIPIETLKVTSDIVKTRLVQKNIIDFAFAALKEFEVLTDTFQRKDGSSVKILSYYQPHHDKYKERGVNALKFAMRFAEQNFGRYNYSTITMIDVPKNSGTIASMEYPALFTYKTNYFSFAKSFELEEVIIHEFLHQYFYAVVANNEVYEAWLDEGIVNYLTTKVLEQNYKEKTSYFNLFGYYPVRGLLLLEIADIPVIYTLSNAKIPFIAECLTGYYRYPDFGSISDSSFLLLNQKVYNSVTYSKSEILFHTIERYLGREEFFNLLKIYYDNYAFKHPTGEDFWNIILKNSSKDLSSIYQSFYKDVSITDYKISDVLIFDKYVEVFVQKIGTAEFPTEVMLYTNKGTFTKMWDAKDQVKKIVFNIVDEAGNTPEEIIGAEIDPLRKNLFDVNFANNSKLVNLQVSGALSIALRWFFWVQNLLMISGGLV